MYSKVMWTSLVKVSCSVLLELLLPGVAGYEDVLTVKRRDLPLVRAAGGAGLGFRDDRQTLKIALERRRGKGRHGDETQRHDEGEQHGENALFHVFFPFVQISRRPAGRCFCAQKACAAAAVQAHISGDKGQDP